MARKISLNELDRRYQDKPGTPVFAHLAALLLEEGKIEQAEEVVRAGVVVLPDYAFGHMVFAEILSRQESYQNALEEIEKALALDPWNPEGWKLYRTVTEKLGLADKKEFATLNWHIADPFEMEAVDAFYPSEFSGDWLVSEKAETQQAPEIEFTPPAEEEKVDEAHFDGIFTDAPTEEEESGDEAEDFEKALDEVFQESEPEADFKGFQFDMPEEEEGEIEAGEEVSAEGEAESESESAFFSDEEFDNAIDSFLEEFGEEEGSEAIKEDKPAAETVEKQAESFPAEEILDEVLLSSEAETGNRNLEEEAEEEPGEMISLDDSAQDEEPDYPDDFIDEEPMDFSSVVADIISEREGETEMESGPELGEDKTEQNAIDESGEVPVEFEQITRPEGVEPEEWSEEESAPQNLLPEAPAEEKPKESGQEQKDKPQFGRPPIVSPTLGEIYIAQGRFEEAIDIFRQLLNGDPENQRYQRKIKDLEEIIAKTREEGDGN